MFDFEYLKRWAARPFNPDMGMWGWVFFLGFMLCVLFFWRGVVKLITQEI